MNSLTTDKKPAIFAGHWFVLGAAILWGTAGTSQAFFGISLIFTGLLVLVIKRKIPRHEISA